MASNNLEALLASFDDEEDEMGDGNETFHSVQNSVDATVTSTVSYMTCNQTLTSPSKFRDFDTTLDTEFSFMTANQSVVNTPKFSKAAPALENDQILDLEANEQESGDFDATFTSIRERILEQNDASKRGKQPVVEKKSNVNIYIDDMTSKAKNIKEQLTKSDSVKPFDPVFGIKVLNPKLTSTILTTYCSGFKKIKISSLRLNNLPTGEWFTMGVIVEKTEYRKSAKNNEYMIWKLSDLTTFQDEAVKVLLFGDCVKQHWKLPEGSVVALTNPQFAEAADSKTVTIKLAKATQIVDIGSCPDYGRCKASKNDGAPCTNYVNVSSSDYCVYHITMAASMVSARRGALNSEFNSPIGNRVVKPPKMVNFGIDERASPHVFVRASFKKEELLEEESKSAFTKSVSKEEVKSCQDAENTKLEELKSRKFNFGAKNLNLIKNREEKAAELKKCIKPPMDPRAFLKEQQLKRQSMSSSRPPAMMELSIEKPKSSSILLSQAEANKQKLIERIKKDGGLQKVDPNKPERPKKRLASQVEEVSMVDKENDQIKKVKMTSSTGKSYSKSDIEALLGKKSIHEDAIDEVQREKEGRYFNSMEVREKIETNLTETTELKNVRVITCKKCNYTSEKQSSLCMMGGHLIQRHRASKRFFKCQGCKQRITIFEMMPVKPCEKCGCSTFDRVGMRDERQVKGDKLVIRGDEIPFVNR